MKKPNILFVFSDQWRAQACGYAGDPNVKTPNVDQFALESVNFDNAVSGCPVCTPYRASLMTGVYPHKHKLMVNDQCLYDRYKGPFLAECLRDGGYKTAYIGKWHIDGKGRNAFVPPERRLGFEWWKGFECTHDYNRSPYYFVDDPRPHMWKGYDAEAQTDEACRYLNEEAGDDPFALFLSWGPPHNPYETAPEDFRAMYSASDIELSSNVPERVADDVREALAGYYAHCSALDVCFGRLLDELKSTGLDKNTIVVFTSDHGDMLGSHGMSRKQKPWAESIRVPFLVRHPEVDTSRTEHAPIDAPDLMPTLLSLAGLPIPNEVQGKDFGMTIIDGRQAPVEKALLALYRPFHEWRYDNGGRELRGLFDPQYTYVRSLDGPWLLYDNQKDPAQLTNLIDDSEYEGVIANLDSELSERLDEVGDDFATGDEIVAREKYELGPGGDIRIAGSTLPEPYED